MLGRVEATTTRPLFLVFKALRRIPKIWPLAPGRFSEEGPPRTFTGRELSKAGSKVHSHFLGFYRGTEPQRKILLPKQD